MQMIVDDLDGKLTSLPCAINKNKWPLANEIQIQKHGAERSARTKSQVICMLRLWYQSFKFNQTWIKGFANLVGKQSHQRPADG